MCGRYSIIPDPNAWSIAFNLSSQAKELVTTLKANYNVFPSSQVPILRMNSTKGQSEITFAHWGLIPFWAKTKAIGNRMINARSETVHVKPAYRDCFSKRRCIIPASGFFEWRKPTAGGAKQPYLIRMHDRSVFGFAGLWEHWQNPENGNILESCAVLTTQANESMRKVHERMPVILDRRDYTQWVDQEERNLQFLLQPCPSDWIELVPVSTYVNNPNHNDPGCIEAIPF